MRDSYRHSNRVLLVVCGLCLVAGAALQAAEPVTLHVAPDGKAEWSGRLAAPSADGSDGPLPSIVAARDAIRARRAKGEWKDAAITVAIRGGRYELAEPLTFEAEDSGTTEAPVTYAAREGESPVLSGGRVIAGFKPVEVDGRRLWAAPVEGVKEGTWYFRQLFVNGARAPRTRLPKDGFHQFAGLPTTRPDTAWGQGQDQATFKEGDLKPWKNLSDVEVVAMTLWIESRLPIAEVDEQQRLVKFGKKSVFRLTDGFSTNNFSRYYVENVFEALDTPGQWYLDRLAGTLYYMPRPGETPDNLQVIAPRLAELVRVSGAHDLRFKGLTFQHAEWTLPADSAGFAQAAVGVPGAVVMDKTQRCVLESCTVSQVSNYAVELLEGSQDNQVVNCELKDLGAGGVKIGHKSAKTTVQNCDIGPGGAVFHAAVGVWIGSSGDNLVSHNDIHDLYYTGVSVGWSWGYGCSPAARNIVEYNHISNLGKGLLSDMGGIYTLGISPGTILRNNHIHDIAASGYGGWGIYTDEGSTGILIENNVVYRTTHGGFHQHYGCQNMVRNNIFAFAMNAQLQRTRVEPHLSFVFERNVVFWLAGPLLGSNWTGDNYHLDSNCYWRVDGKPIEFADMSFEQWQAKGQDRNSVIADPGFADAQGGNFTLKPDSPALKVGFKPIDTSKIGRGR